MTHVEVLKSLPGALRVRLQTRSDAAGLWHLASHLVAIAVTGTWIAQGWVLWPVVMVLHGVLVVFLFTLQHECTHDTPFATPRLNRIVGHAVGVVIFQPFQWFRLFHMAHHRHTHDPDHDPELTEGTKPESWAAWVWHVSGVPVWVASLSLIVRNATRPTPAPYLPASALPRLRKEARGMLAVYALAALSFSWTDALLWLWLVPMAMGQPFLRLYLLAEHGRCPHVADMLENTRTTFTTRAVRWLAWNMPYHIEHHAAPNVPFHNLPELHRHMAPHLKSTSPSYAAFTRDYVSDFT
ncbi:fatty acid desaturase [Pseudaestuariivita atlantica]|uniref:Fatty acid desaturase n=1 Tax=Pseudaestuariivita atlantica TaxID=1317121 RepID=A0A0L1JUY9_9RHOB|nr:fatty acid desaturase [Pseudaestuariivita atlantica]KNG95497.1 fatty acid desaturase [Pseudaestuariivita atlantica]